MEILNLRHFVAIPFYLTVRTHSTGKGLAGFLGGTGLKDEVTELPGYPDPRTAHKGHLTLWIHGYNNAAGAIAEIWQQTAVALSNKGISLADVVCFFWPGDQWRSTKTSALAYPLQVRVARQAAIKLADYFINGSPQRELRIRLVAHSLGCLVALETVRLLGERSSEHRIIIEDTVLMAAAVPQGLCIRDFGLYRHGWGMTPSDRALYSVSDKVLGYAFRLGQRVAETFLWAEVPSLDSWAYRRAVGREGGPTRRWRSKPMTGFDHGDYWLADDTHEQMASAMSPATAQPRLARPKSHPPIPDWRVSERRPKDHPPSRRDSFIDWRAERDPSW